MHVQPSPQKREEGENANQVLECRNTLAMELDPPVFYRTHLGSGSLHLPISTNIVLRSRFSLRQNENYRRCLKPTFHAPKGNVHIGTESQYVVNPIDLLSTQLGYYIIPSRKQFESSPACGTVLFLDVNSFHREQTFSLPLSNLL